MTCRNNSPPHTLSSGRSACNSSSPDSCDTALELSSSQKQSDLKACSDKAAGISPVQEVERDYEHSAMQVQTFVRKSEGVSKVESFEQIVRGLVENVIEEFSVKSGGQLVSDETRVNRKGIFIKTVADAQSRPSLLTELLRQRANSKLNKETHNIESLNESDPNYASINIIIPRTKEELKVAASKQNTIEDVINYIYSIYKSKDADNKQFPYKTPEGYELRLVDDLQPIYEMNALERAGKLGEYDLDAVAFCPKKSFRERSKTTGTVTMKVHVYTNKQRITMVVQSDPEQSFQILFYKIAAMRNLAPNSDLYKFLKYSPSNNYTESIRSLLQYKECVKGVEMMMPVGKLRASEVVLMERLFADTPKGNVRTIKSFARPTGLVNLQREWEALTSSDSLDILNNTASDYHEYNVMKLGKLEQKYNRILAIDKYGIYNQRKKNNIMFMNMKLAPIFQRKENFTRPVIPMCDVVRIERDNNDTAEFSIYHKENEKLKCTTYIAASENMLEQIITKVKYLMFLHKQDNKIAISYINQENSI